MTTLTKIVTGMEKGPEAIQGNFDTLNGAIGQAVAVPDWSSDGVTLLNGFTNASTSVNDTLGYHFYYINGVPKILLLKGKLYVPKGVAAGTNVEVAGFPSAVFDFMSANRSLTSWWGGTDDKGNDFTFSLNADKSKLIFSCGVTSDSLGWISANKIFIV